MKKSIRRLVLVKLLVVFTLSLSAQSVTLNYENVSLKVVLASIKKQTGLNFSYSTQQVNPERTLSINISGEPVENALKKLLAGTNLTFEKKDKNILIYEKPNAEKNVSVKSKKITGLVTDEKGDPIIGASIVIKGINTGTITNVDGKFSLEASEQAVLSISYIGYVSTEIKVASKNNLIVVLKEDSKALDEVVVVGYATTTKRKLTTAITSVKMDDIDKGASNNALQSLQGKTAGVNISAGSGVPGSNPNVIIRGVGSFQGNSSPLYVVDGIPMESFPNLNQNDIESIDILKDASASAIYGSRGNYGIVLITTKSGKAGKTKVDINTRYGVGSVANDITMANSNQYIDVMQAAVNNYNAQKGTALNFYIPTTIEETNWTKLISRQQAVNSELNINISGGDDKTTFFASFGNNTQEGYINTSLFRQYNFRTNLTHKINKYFKLNINLGVNQKFNQKVEQESSSLKVLRTAREEQPWYIPYDELGNYKVNAGLNIVRHNPVMLINEENWTVNGLTGLGTISLDFTPIEGLKYTPSISGYGYLSDEIKKLTEKHDARKNSWPAITQNRNESYRYVVNNVLSYTNNVGDLNYTALIGHEFWYRAFNDFGAKSETYLNGAFPSSSFDLLNAGANIYADGIGYGAYAVESYFSRLTLDYKDRYFVNASIRKDASSKLTKEIRDGYFPSASFAWKASNEKFFPKQNIVNDLKLRVSWGQTGSIDPIGNFNALSLVTAGKSYYGKAGFSLSNDAQPLKWEKTDQYNGGLDMELFNGKVSLNADYFYKHSHDLLYDRPIQYTSGFTAITANIGSIENSGVELAANYKLLTGKFKLNIGVNISFISNKLLSIYPGAPNPLILPSAGGSSLYGGSIHALIVGRPVSTYYLYNMLGLYQKDSDVPEKLYNKGVRAGDVQYEDVNVDGDVSELDRKDVGKATPDYFGGVNTSMSWKGFDLSIVGRFSVGAKVFASWQGANGVEGTDNPAMSPASTSVGEQYYNVREFYALNYWKGEGTSNTVPRPIRTGVHTGYSTGYNSLSSTRYLEDASFFKLQTITFGYNLPSRLLSKIKINSLKLFVTAENMLTFSKYSGYDPEASFSSSPANSNYGVDFGLEPNLRVISVGISIKL
jgi:TonB-linked SusC/RagA family outer membrane protein